MRGKGSVGSHLRNKPQDTTKQSKITTDPPLPCKGTCGRMASTSRKDGYCENCGEFQDYASKRGKK
jgi:hypothetical protein